MANTTNLNLIKLDGTEKLKTYPASFNSNMDDIDSAVGNEINTTRTVTQAIAKAEESIAIVANGNTHVAIASGQYVYVKNHGSLAEGLYTATTAISANATLSGSNLSAVSGGGLNNVYSTLNNNLTWTLVGSVSDLNIPIAIPSTAKEIYFKIKQSGFPYWDVTGYILKASLTSGEEYYRYGNPNLEVIVLANTTSIKVDAFKTNGTTVIPELFVWCR